MRLVFLTGCLEPGRSGVGDYTRDLAEECVRQGHECLLLALHDSFVQGEKAAFVGEQVSSIRFGTDLPWPERVRQAARLVREFQPAWISVQFVPYAYDARGLPFGLERRLREICGDTPRQIMFHEIWIGEARGASAKHRLIGWVQKALVSRLLRRLRPAVIHTNCSAYTAVLRRQGWPAERLPLCGSIPIASSGQTGWLEAKFAEAGLALTGENRTGFWVGGIFGSLHPEWEPEPLLSILGQAAAAAGRRLVLCSIGHRGAAGDARWRELQTRYPQEPALVEFGPQPPERLSEIFQALDFGVAATPAGLIGKSASAAAMLEHGLPVVVTRDDYALRFPFQPEEMRDPRLLPLTPELGARLQAAAKEPPLAGLPLMAQRFLAALAMHS